MRKLFVLFAFVAGSFLLSSQVDDRVEYPPIGRDNCYTVCETVWHVGLQVIGGILVPSVWSETVCHEEC